MAKKSFIDKDNPALQFISVPDEEPDEEPDEARAADPLQEAEEGRKDTAEAMTPKKAPRETYNPPAGYKVDPAFIELKSRRVQVLLTPSLYERLKAGAIKRGYSVNEYINRVLDEATKGE